MGGPGCAQIDWGFVVVKPPLEICFVGLIWGKNVLLKVELNESYYANV